MQNQPHTSPEDLFFQHLGLARAIARQVWRLQPRCVEFEDLVAYAEIGLLEASRRYRPDEGARFSTFAYYRVRGEVLDGVRKLRAGERDRALALAANFDALVEDSCSEEAENAGLELEQIFENCLAAACLAAASEREDGATFGLEQREELAQLRICMEALSEEEQELLRCVYFEGQSLSDIATARGVHKSTISRAHAASLGRLRQRMEARSGLATFPLAGSGKPTLDAALY